MQIKITISKKFSDDSRIAELIKHLIKTRGQRKAHTFLIKSLMLKFTGNIWKGAAVTTALTEPHRRPSCELLDESFLGVSEYV